MKEEFYLPPREDIAFQSETNKQGREDQAVPDKVKDSFQAHQETTQRELYEHYLQFINEGVARELARINLPLSMYTEWYWKIDLHNLFHFLALRMDPHAQKEIQDYALIMAKMVKAVCPMAFEAFMDYRVDAAYFSGQ